MRLAGTFVTMGLAAALALASAPAFGAPASPESFDPTKVCGVETLRQEHALAIPDRLLHAISLVESGRWDGDRQASSAWPWTVTAEGEGRFLPSKEAAIAEVRRLQAKGIANIDVGCMQVNLQAHPDAFASLDEAFEPGTNVAYGARFLTELRAATPDWATAAAYYHSQTPSLAAAYKAKLVTAWNTARQRADDRILAFADDGGAMRLPIGMDLPAPPHDAAELRAVSAHANAATAAARAVKLSQTLAEREDAKKIADAYRTARIAEYRHRKLQMADARG